MTFDDLEEEIRDQLFEVALARASVLGHTDLKTGRLKEALSRRIAAYECPPVHSVELFLTEECNLRCDYCFVTGKNGRRTMDEATALATIDFLIRQSGPKKTLSILFFGGEPLLAFDVLSRTVLHAEEQVRRRNKKIHFSMTTNGALFTREIAEFCKDHGIRYMLSIDGGKDDHDRHRKAVDGASSFEAVAGRLPMLKEIEPRQSARVTPHPDTVANLSSNVQNLADLGIDDFTIGTAHGVEWSADEYSVYREQMWAVIEMKARLEENGRRIRLNVLTDPARKKLNNAKPCAPDARKKFGCRAGKGYVCVAPDGAVYACSMFYGMTGDRTAGKIGHIHTGFDEKARKALVILNYGRDHKCLTCELAALCSGGCIANNLSETGRFVTGTARTCLDMETKIDLLERYTRGRMISEHLYPSLSDGVSLHVWPSEGMLFRTGDAGSATPMEMDKLTTPALRILEQCNGAKNLGRILLELAAESDSALPLPAARGLLFIHEAAAKGHLVFRESPRLQVAQITGSRDTYYPVHVAVELTDQCNLHCRHCYKESSPSCVERLPTEQLLSILDALAEHGVRVIELTGGEPLMHPDFRRIFDFCAERFGSIGLLTNGTLVDRRLADHLAEYGRKLLVSISLDHSVAAEHDAFRGVPGSFEKARDAIRMLSERGIAVRAGMDVTKENVHAIEDTLLTAKVAGARWFGYNCVLPLGRGKSIPWELTAQEAESITRYEAEVVGRHPGFVAKLPESTLEELKEIGNCGVGYRTFVLGPTGTARPCPMLPEEHLSMGNLATATVAEVFSQPLVKQLHDLRAPEEDACGDCRHLPFCRNCMVRAFLKNEELEAPCRWHGETGLSQWLRAVEPDKTLPR